MAWGGAHKAIDWKRRQREPPRVLLTGGSIRGWDGFWSDSRPTQDPAGDKGLQGWVTQNCARSSSGFLETGPSATAGQLRRAAGPRTYRPSRRPAPRGGDYTYGDLYARGQRCRGNAVSSKSRERPGHHLHADDGQAVHSPCNLRASGRYTPSSSPGLRRGQPRQTDRREAQVMVTDFGMRGGKTIRF